MGGQSGGFGSSGQDDDSYGQSGQAGGMGRQSGGLSGGKEFHSAFTDTFIKF